MIENKTDVQVIEGYNIYETDIIELFNVLRKELSDEGFGFSDTYEFFNEDQIELVDYNWGNKILGDKKKYPCLELKINFKQREKKGLKGLIARLINGKAQVYECSMYVDPFNCHFVSLGSTYYLTLDANCTNLLHQYMKKKFDKVWIDAYKSYCTAEKEIKKQKIQDGHTKALEDLELHYNKKIMSVDL